ncbi:unnamed protein product [Pleuronectes platessa]|uniref:Protein disulfide-isomerase n=1 Tax=Pleuronectes platessa TaxID=8262 RepID=A0A9N7VY48_PLEPL|nr:unnamed protein product [Pleuronectes platessa]
MRTHTLLSLTLLGLLLWASCTRANDAEENSDTPTEAPEEREEEAAGQTEEEEVKKEKTTEIEEEKDVMVLHISNFDRALSENQFLLVEFYAPWCGHCKRLEPVYAEAAGKLKGEEAELRLGKVDAAEEKELAEEFEIGGFPTLKLFINGDRKQPVDFTGKRTAEGIVQWMKRRSGPGAPVLDSAESAAQFIDAHEINVVGFFDDLDSEAAKLFKELSLDVTDTEFALTATPEVFQKYEVKENSVVLFKKFDDGRADFTLSEEGTLDKKNLTKFIDENSLELIIPFKQETSDKIFSSSILLHSLLFINSTVESQVALLDASRPVAKEFKGKMLFIVIDVTAAMSHVLTYFGVAEGDAPTARIINMETGKKRSWAAPPSHTIAQRRSQRTGTKDQSKSWWGKNFESVALDPTKNVFVEFYAPWCGHCKELAPIWDKLGEKYADHEDIIIAKIDSSANELESVTIQGFPTLKYFPAGGKEVVEFSGNRDLETFSKFLDDGGVLPQEESNEVKDEEDEEDVDDEDDDDEDDDDDDAKEGDKDADDSAETPTNTTSKDEL